MNGETGATVGTVDVSNTTHTNAGTYTTDSWSFTGTANYNNQGPTTITDTIAKADATFTVTPYSVTYDGLPHTATVSTITGVNGETGATVGTVDAEQHEPHERRDLRHRQLELHGHRQLQQPGPDDDHATRSPRRRDVYGHALQRGV